MSAEPPKYVPGKDGGLKISKEWKNWRKQVLSNGFERHNKSKKSKKQTDAKIVNAEAHTPHWKEIASVSGSERRIYFCACKAIPGAPSEGCGAVAIKSSRTAALEIVVQSRFE